MKIGGSASAVHQYLQAVDELHFVIAPIVLGQGEAIFSALALPARSSRASERVATELATHVALTK